MNVWRDRLSRWFEAPAAVCPLSPNAISLLALGINGAAAVCLYNGARRPALFLVAIALTAVGGLADAFDGIVARVQGKSSRYGDFLDHFADRVSDVLLATCWMAGSGVRDSLIIVLAILILLNGYAGTQIEATWHQRSYDSVGRGEFVLALVVFPIVSYILTANGWTGIDLGGFTIAELLTILMAIFAIAGIAQRFALARKLERS